MKFFDDKEEVLDIQLTQFGKYQLSVGKWKPVYYAFFDDNILYDGEYAEVTEDQNDIENRIQDETPQMKTQHVFSGRETDFLEVLQERQRQSNDLREEDKIKIQSNPEKFYSLTAPLGTSDFGQQSAPRFSVKVLEGEIENTQNQLTGSFRTLEIPQIDINLTYKFYGQSIYDYPSRDSFGQIDAEEIAENVFLDGTFFEIEDGQILIELEELNVPFDNENFDIEVFEVTTPASSSNNGLEGLSSLQTIEQKYFIERKPQVVNNILVSDTPEDVNVDIDSTYVEYYFDVYVDDEIDPNVISRATEVVKSKNIYTDSEYKVATPPFVATAADLYRDVTSTDLTTCADDDTSSAPRAKITSRSGRPKKSFKPFED